MFTWNLGKLQLLFLLRTTPRRTRCLCKIKIKQSTPQRKTPQRRNSKRKTPFCLNLMTTRMCLWGVKDQHRPRGLNHRRGINHQRGNAGGLRIEAPGLDDPDGRKIL